jgi:DNA (cytosine-5)-methyltransferase 1
VTVTIGSLFSGIGGLELGLERAALGPVVFQCEIDPFCRAVLAKHWPNVTRFVDVTQPRRYPSVDLLCGGFPCQDVSSAGKRRGLGGSRSGLWYHFASIVRQIRPRFVVVENVASGQTKWLPTVRRDLRRLGYRTRALGIAAREVGAPHLRRRVFVVAYSHGNTIREQSRRSGWAEGKEAAESRIDGANGRALSDAHGEAEHARAVDAEVAHTSTHDADVVSTGPRPTHTKSGVDLPQVLGGHLCPTFCEWFMGYPKDWTLLAPESQPSATPSSRSARKSLGSSSSK